MIKQLEKEFPGKSEVKGFSFRQITKSDKAYLYEVDVNGKKHYEVFKHKINTQFGCISYPNSKSFGNWAWTKNALKEAQDQFIYLNNK